MAAKRKTPKPFTRKGLHRLECSGLKCDGFAYLTIARLERNLKEHGRLLVCACGEEMRAESIDLVFALGLDDDRLNADMQRTLLHKESNQRRSLGGTNTVELKRSAGTLNDMFAKTIDDMRQEQRERAHARRRRGLSRVAVTVDEMPF